MFKFKSTLSILLVLALSLPGVPQCVCLGSDMRDFVVSQESPCECRCVCSTNDVCLAETWSSSCPCPYVMVDEGPAVLSKQETVANSCFYVPALCPVLDTSKCSANPANRLPAVSLPPDHNRRQSLLSVWRK